MHYQQLHFKSMMPWMKAAWCLSHRCYVIRCLATYIFKLMVVIACMLDLGYVILLTA